MGDADSQYVLTANPSRVFFGQGGAGKPRPLALRSSDRHPAGRFFSAAGRRRQAPATCAALQ